MTTFPPVKSQTKAPVSVQPSQAGMNEAGKTCAICATPVSQGEQIVVCPFCMLPYHHECWKEVGGCGTYGCKAAPDAPKTKTIPTDEYQPGWVAEKTCPSCRKNINASALKCKFCGAIFSTEKPLTPEQYRNREYEGEELLIIRNKVIGNFIFSAIGCLFFISIITNILHLTNREGLLFQIKRLPPSLKVLFYASCGISVFWGIIVIFFLVFGI